MADPTRKHRSIIRLVASAATLTSSLALLSCASARPEADTGPASTETAARAGIDNLHRVTNSIWSGAEPSGDAGFQTLARLGVRTVISVDARRPDLARLDRFGMRSIHIPIHYSGIDDEARLKLARAVRTSEGPVFIHCHHGKHRGPAAAAVAAVSLGMLDQSQGLELLSRAGTSHAYEGLWRAVAEASRIDPAELDSWTGTLPVAVEPAGMQGAMIRIASHFEMLDQIAVNDWRALRDSPDRTALSEASALVDALRVATDLSQAGEPGFRGLMGEALDDARQIETALDAGGLAKADEWLLRLDQRCADCHARYRAKRIGAED